MIYVIIKYFLNLFVMIIIYKFVFLISVINLFNINFFMRIYNVRIICKIFLFCYKFKDFVFVYFVNSVLLNI